MIFAVVSLFAVMVALLIKGVCEARREVHRFDQERDQRQAPESAGVSAYGPLQDYNFTRSLLALSKARSLTRDDFPAPVLAGSSSSASALHPQLKTLDPVL